MSRLAELIVEHCPDGVDFMSLDSLIDYEQPGKYLVSSTAYRDDFATPVLTAGQTFVLGHTDEMNGVYPASATSPVVIFDDFTTAFKWVDFPFKAKSSAMKMLTPKPGSTASLRFLYYAMRTIEYAPQDHARQWISTYSKFRVPVPPPEVQREVVRQLDLVAQLSKDLQLALKQEIRARRVQHGFYRRRILDEISKYDAVPLHQVADFFNAKAHEKLVSPDGDVALLTARFISTEGRMARYVRQEDVLTPACEGDVALVMSDLPNGRALARTFLVDANDKYAANQRVCLLRARDKDVVSPRFLSQVLNRHPALLSYDNGAEQTHLKKGYIQDLLLALPPLPEQLRLVELLERLDASFIELVNVALPAEAAARSAQFDHYSRRLLHFPSLTTGGSAA